MKKSVPTLIDLSSQIHEYGKRLSSDKRAAQFATQLLLMAQKEPKIALATPASILTAFMACVHLDLMPNTPEQLSYIIPYLNRQTNIIEAQFQVGYKGLVELAYRSGEIKSMAAEVVYANDKFKVKLGTERRLIHEPIFDNDREVKNIVAGYSTAKLLNGDSVFAVMTVNELMKVRKTAKAKTTDTPWETWFEEMAKKTVVKRMLKLLPKSKTDERLNYAAAYDSWAESGKLRLIDGTLTEETTDQDTPKAGTPQEIIVNVTDVNAKIDEMNGETTEEEQPTPQEDRYHQSPNDGNKKPTLKDRIAAEVSKYGINGHRSRQILFWGRR